MAKKKRMRKNPPLVVFGNPRNSRVVSENTVDIRYQHAEDGKYYRHGFRRGQVRIIGNATSSRCVLERVDGKPILGEY